MGYRVAVLDPDPLAPAAQLADIHIARSWTDVEAVTDMAAVCDAVTIEFENIPADVLRALAAHVIVRPSADAVAATQDRLDEKAFLNGLGIATASWAPIRSSDQLETSWQAIGGVAGVLKTARMGYDGKGQAIVTSAERLAIGARTARLRAMHPRTARRAGARGFGHGRARGRWRRGDLASRPRTSIATASSIPPSCPRWCRPRPRRLRVASPARSSMRWIMSESWVSNASSPMAVRCLSTNWHPVRTTVATGRSTPARPASSSSRSAAWRGCRSATRTRCHRSRWPTCSATCGTTARHGGSAALAIPGVRLHLYGKRDARPGRKMGHLTAVADTPELALDRVLEAWDALGDGVS